MSFRCDSCGASTLPGVKMVHLAETEPYRHPARFEGQAPFRIMIDPGGNGSRVTNEIALCLECAGRNLSEAERRTLDRHEARCKAIRRRAQDNIARTMGGRR